MFGIGEEFGSCGGATLLPTLRRGEPKVSRG